MQFFQKLRRMAAVHLGVMELKGDGEPGFPEPFPVFSPNQKRIVVKTGVDIHCAVDVALGKGGGSDNHGLPAEIIGLAGIADLLRETQVVPLKLL